MTIAQDNFKNVNINIAIMLCLIICIRKCRKMLVISRKILTANYI